MKTYHICSGESTVKITPKSKGDKKDEPSK